MQIFLFFYSILAFLLPVTTKKVCRVSQRSTPVKRFILNPHAIAWDGLVDIVSVINYRSTGTGNDV